MKFLKSPYGQKTKTKLLTYHFHTFITRQDRVFARDGCQPSTVNVNFQAKPGEECSGLDADWY